jgi:hypothetical protein
MYRPRRMKRPQSKVTGFPLLRMPLAILLIVLEDVRTQLVVSLHFPLLIASISFTKLIGKPSSTFASFRKHAAMSPSTCSTAASEFMTVP